MSDNPTSAPFTDPFVFESAHTERDQKEITRLLMRLKAAEAELAAEKARADEIHRREVTIAAEYAKGALERDALRSILHDIHTTCHCLAMSGPASTPTLNDAWAQFMKIEGMAVKGLADVRAAREGGK